MRPFRVFNDETMEVVTTVTRLLAILGVLAVLASFFFAIWTGDTRWVWTLLVSVLAVVAFGYLGFWTLGNAEWTEKPRA